MPIGSHGARGACVPSVWQICMVWDDNKGITSALYWIDWVVNLSFMVDIGINFVLPYRESVAKGAYLVKQHAKIARAPICSRGKFLGLGTC